jgi:hypothetical protein
MDLLLCPIESAAKPLLTGLPHYRSLDIAHLTEYERLQGLASLLEDCLAQNTSEYLPPLRVAMRQFAVTRLDRAATDEISVIDRYEAIYRSQAQSKRLRHNGQIFCFTLECITKTSQQPFVALNVDKLMMKVKSRFSDSASDLDRMVKRVLHWRKLVELSKARILGIAQHDLYKYLSANCRESEIHPGPT